MKRMLLGGLALGLVGIGVLEGGTALLMKRDRLERTLGGGMLGPVHLLRPDGDIAGVSILFSDRDGWDASGAALAAGLARRGIVTIGVDLPRALAGMNKQGGDCVDPSWLLQDISHHAQRGLRDSTYHPPILAGIGDGATLALRLAATATPATMGGVIALDPGAGGLPVKPLCGQARGTSAPVTAPIAASILLSPQGDAALARAEAAHLGAPPPTRPAAAARGDALADAIAARATTLQADEGAVESLPIVPLAVPPTLDMLAIVYSGDGGWRDLDKEVAEALQAQGIPTVGVDMLRYFWSARSPQESAGDLSRLIAHFSEKWGTRKVLLIGYSFGADVLPILYDLLPLEQRQQVVQLSLLALSANANFEVSVGQWLTNESASTLPTKPALAKIDPGLIQCFQGREDGDGICGDLAKNGIEVQMTEGGHHFDGDYERLARLIVEGARHRLGLPPGPITPAGE